MKKEPTTDAVEILHRQYGYSLLHRWKLWRIRRQLKKDKQEYTQGFRDGYHVGQKSKEKYPYLKMPGTFDRILQE